MTVPIATIESVQPTGIAHEIWDMKYRFKNQDGTPVDVTVSDTWWRVAKELAVAESPLDRHKWEQAFYDVMAGFKFLPAGRIIAGAGTGRRVTLFNCFVMGALDDSMTGIFDGLKEAALTMQQGGGIGTDFSPLRYKGAEVKQVGSDASGPLSFMDCWDSMCRTIMSAGTRRGAMMATMRCDHPDIEAFVEAKRDPAKLRNFNVSVMVTDEFMHCVKNDYQWPLIFGEGVERRIVKTIGARQLWDKIIRATYDVAEPGVIFIDRVNQQNNLSYVETISATNPCAEQPLPPYGACLLGSVNLAAFVKNPFNGATMDYDDLKHTVSVAVRMMDNVVDLSNYPLPQQEVEAKAKRRIGLGVTGLADALAMQGLRYGTGEAAHTAEVIMTVVEDAAYSASCDLAFEKGYFPLFNADDYLASGHVKTLPAGLRERIAVVGIRNALVTSIAPTGTISLFAGNVSSGVEPIFAYDYERKVLLHDGTHQVEAVVDHAVRLYRETHPGEPLPNYFVTAQDLTPHEHLIMQAAVQRHVDSAVSKTINCPKSISFDDFKAVYEEAYDLGLKGCTTYRPNDVTGSVLSVSEPKPAKAEVKSVSDGTLPSREEALPGRTYKLKFGDTEHALYVTINDLEDESGRRPYEIFLNSKNMEHYAWAVALTRMVSAVFRRGGDVSFVVEELKAVFDPRGGHWHKGKYVPSTVAAIGGVIEQHLAALYPSKITKAEPQPYEQGRQCPKCSDMALIKQSGCDTCLSCGYSKCG